MKMIIELNIVVFSFLLFVQNASSQSLKKPGTSKSINGSWELVWSKWNGKIKSPGKPMAFQMINNGLGTVLLQDSTGKWNQGAVFTFAIIGKSFRQKVKYDTDSSFIGWQFWQDVEL